VDSLGGVFFILVGFDRWERVEVGMNGRGLNAKTAKTAREGEGE
jgi:hypothetical protein